jgi:diguanylate cyclase
MDPVSGSTTLSPARAAAAVVAAALLAGALGAAIAYARLLALADRQVDSAASFATSRLEYEFRSRLRMLELVAIADAQPSAGPAGPIADDARGVDRATMLAAIGRLFPELVWVGFTDADGRVTLGHLGLLEGTDVAGQAWWQGARRGPHVGGPRPPTLLAGVLNEAGGPPRLVELAVPLRDARGTTVGVLAAFLHEHWVARLRESMREAWVGLDDADLLLQRDGTTVSGRAVRDADGSALGAQAAGRLRGSVDGAPRTMLVTSIEGDVVVDRLGWRLVIARSPAAHAAEARALALALLGAGVAAGALGAAWIVLRTRRRRR